MTFGEQKQGDRAGGDDRKEGEAERVEAPARLAQADVMLLECRQLILQQMLLIERMELRHQQQSALLAGHVEMVRLLEARIKRQDEITASQADSNEALRRVVATQRDLINFMHQHLPKPLLNSSSPSMQ